MHLNIAQGEVANRILCVGDHGRAARFTQFFDEPDSKYVNLSKRGFAIYTGTYKGVKVSIIGTGMGTPMTDFTVRECRFMTQGKMAIVRYGTSGIIQSHIPAGAVMCSITSRMVSRNYDFDPSDPSSKAYLVSKRLNADQGLVERVRDRLKEALGDANVIDGMDLTGDSFYDSQGRVDANFRDDNEDLIERIKEVEPSATNFQMETFTLYHLADISKGSIIAAAAAIGLLNRLTNEVIPEELLREREMAGGRAILQALIDTPLE